MNNKLLFAYKKKEREDFASRSVSEFFPFPLWDKDLKRRRINAINPADGNDLFVSIVKGNQNVIFSNRIEKHYGLTFKKEEATLGFFVHFSDLFFHVSNVIYFFLISKFFSLFSFDYLKGKLSLPLSLCVRKLSSLPAQLEQGEAPRL